MLRYELTYTNFNDEEDSAIMWFHISKPELLQLSVSVDGGFAEMLQRIVDTKDNKELVERYKEIILLAYGHKSDDGKSFLKNAEIRGAFEQTAAFQELFMRLVEDEDAAVKFFTEVLPKDVQEQDKPEIEKRITDTQGV